MSVIDLTRVIKDRYPGIPIVALSPSPAHRISEDLRNRHVAAVDYLYYWQGNANIFLAMVKLLEDKMNALHDANAAAQVPVIILVENSIRFYSSYLPILNTSSSSIPHEHEAKDSILGNRVANAWTGEVLLAQNYEEALELFATFRNNLLGIITDISFDREGQTDHEAGLRFCRHVREHLADLPILLQSTKDDYAQEAAKENASFIWKLSPSLLNDLRQYVFEYYGFGPFIFKDEHTGAEVARAENLREMQHVLPSVPLGCFIRHTEHNDFSRWLKARSLYVLANLFRPYSVKDFTSPEEMRDHMVEMIKEFRLNRGKGVIAQFNRNSFDELSFFSRIGSGSLGGKGRGLAFIDYKLRQSDIIDKYQEMYLSIRDLVIATDLFTQFMEEKTCMDVVAPRSPDETLRQGLSSRRNCEELHARSRSDHQTSRPSRGPVSSSF